LNAQSAVESQPMPIEYNCQTCGACCAFFTVPVDSTEQHGPEWLKRWTQPDSGSRIMRGTKGGNGPDTSKRPLNRCIALSGGVGVAVHCALYSSERPQVCPDFRPGCELCNLARSAYHLPVDARFDSKAWWNTRQRVDGTP